MAYPANPYEEYSATGIIPAGSPGEWTVIQLPEKPAQYEFHSLSIGRTAGAASANVQPVLSTNNAVNDANVDKASGPIAYGNTPAGSATFLPTAIRSFTTNGPLYLAINPNVFGDTFRYTLRLKRVF